MKICLVAPGSCAFDVHSGIGQYIRILARGLETRGHSVTIVAVRPPGSSHRVPARENTIFLPPVAHRLSESGIGPLLDARAVRTFLRFRGAEFDIVELSNWSGNGAFLPKGMPAVVRLSSPTRHCVPSGSTTRIVDRAEARTCRRARFILANSQAMWDEAKRLYGCDRVPSAIVSHGLPDIRPYPSPTANQDFTIMYVGRAELRKGTDLFIKALHRVMPSCPRMNVRILGGYLGDFASKDPDLDACWSFLKKEMPERMVELGAVDEETKHRELAGAHWVVIPSRFESFGIVAIEAMRAGTPILACAAGGLKEVCARSPANILYDPSGDEDVLAASLVEAYAAGTERALSLRPDSRRTYLEFYTEDQFVEQSLVCYLRAIQQGKSGNVGT